VTVKATEAAGVGLDAIDMIVTNTITGLAIPSLDAMLLNRLKLPPTVERLPIFGLGCGAGVAGLARAARLAHAKDGAHVLFLTVDLCSLCLRVNDPSPAMFVSSALFGDGAAGLLLHNTRNGSRAGPRIMASGEWCWRNTEHIMGWDIKDDGFGIVLSPELPSLMKKELAPALQDFLDRNGLSLGDFNGFLFHPGGRKLLETMEEVLGLTRDQLRHSWEVLRRYGNMSSATVLFVLDHAVRTGACGRHLLAAESSWCLANAWWRAALTDFYVIRTMRLSPARLRLCRWRSACRSMRWSFPFSMPRFSRSASRRKMPPSGRWPPTDPGKTIALLAGHGASAIAARVCSIASA
jgi:alkylresorcinol/alkylpyrone synthase